MKENFGARREGPVTGWKMRLLRPLSAAFLAAVTSAFLGAGFLQAQTLVTFEQASDLSLFNVNLNGEDRTNFAFAAGVGVGGSGGLNTSNVECTATYVGPGGVANPVSFSLAQPIVVSVFFETTAATTDRPIQIGFLSMADASFNNDTGAPATPATLAFAGFRPYMDGRMEFQKRDLTTAPSTYGTTNNLLGTSSASPDLVQGDFYKASFTLQLTNAATGAIAYSMLLQNFGPDGISTPVTVFDSGLQTETIRGGSFSSGQGFAGVRQVQGAPHIDNFAVTVPEPASAALLACAAVGICSQRRRRQ
jgi:hypothetical protein